MTVRRFELHRDEGTSGISGTGVVAEGVEWSDGRVALRWLTRWGSTAVYDSIDAVRAIHGHGGATRVVWVDQLLPEQIRQVSADLGLPAVSDPAGTPRWRTGSRVGRTLYYDDGTEERLVGLLDTPALARVAVDALNAREEFQQLA